jgi:hypothetical protein
LKNETKNEKQPCACCSIFFNSQICPQCQVAGCASKGKKEKCRLQANMMQVMQLSEFQVRSQFAELKTKYAELYADWQRLARILEDPQIERRLAQLSPPLDAAGNDPRFGHPPTPDNRQHTVVGA